MCWVYVLKSLKDNKLYIGMTKDFEKRIREHNKGQVKSTRGRRPFVVIYKEFFESREQARIREKYLKSGSGRKFLKRSGVAQW